MARVGQASAQAGVTGFSFNVFEVAKVKMRRLPRKLATWDRPLYGEVVGERPAG